MDMSPGQFQGIPPADYGMEGSHVTYAHTVANLRNDAQNALARKGPSKPGIEWFDEHHKTAKRIGGGDPEKGAGIIASLSGETPWEKNLQMAHEIVGGKISPEQFEQVRAGDRSPLKGTALKRHPTVQVMKAYDIHRGALDPTHPKAFSSPKTRNFQRNLAHPEDTHAVTIDYRMYDSAMGQKMPTGKAAPRRLDKAPRYDYLADAARDAAGQLGLGAPHELQSLIWGAQRSQDYGKRRT